MTRRNTAATLPANVAFGRSYGGVSYATPTGRVWMFRKGQKVRFYDHEGVQVGPEQRNVAPAVAFAMYYGWQAIYPRSVPLNKSTI